MTSPVGGLEPGMHACNRNWVALGDGAEQGKDLVIATALLAVIAGIFAGGGVVPLVIVAFAFMGFAAAMFIRARPESHGSGIDLG